MGKFFGLLLAAIAFTTFALFASRHWWMPPGASESAPLLDSQLKWGLIDIGVIFLIAQLALAVFVWRFRARTGIKASTVPQAVRIAVIIAVLFIAIELLSAATLGWRAWAGIYAGTTANNTISVEAMGQQFAYYFRYPGEDGKFGQVHVEKIDPSVGNYFGLDRTHDIDARDDIVSAELVLPVDRPVDLILDAQDGSTAFTSANSEYSRTWFRECAFLSTSRRPRSGSMRLPARSCAASDIIGCGLI